MRLSNAPGQTNTQGLGKDNEENAPTNARGIGAGGIGHFRVTLNLTARLRAKPF